MLEPSSPALGAGRTIEEPPFLMAVKKIFKNFSAKAVTVYFGNPVGQSQSDTNIE